MQERDSEWVPGHGLFGAIWRRNLCRGHRRHRHHLKADHAFRGSGRFDWALAVKTAMDQRHNAQGVQGHGQHNSDNKPASLHGVQALPDRSNGSEVGPTVRVHGGHRMLGGQLCVSA